MKGKITPDICIYKDDKIILTPSHNLKPYSSGGIIRTLLPENRNIQNITKGGFIRLSTKNN